MRELDFPRNTEGLHSHRKAREIEMKTILTILYGSLLLFVYLFVSMFVKEKEDLPL
jgi:hypothetical protein